MAIEIVSMICPLLFKKDVSVKSDVVVVEDSVLVGGIEIICENLPFKNVSKDDAVPVATTSTMPHS